MRDPERLAKTLNLIYRIWKKNTDLRLNQLILNVFEDTSKAYHCEDEDLERMLIEKYGAEFQTR